MSAIKAVVFDLDDTLYPEREYAFSGFDAVAAKFEDVLGSRERASARMRELFETEHRRRVFDALLAEQGIAATTTLIQAMVTTYRAHAPRISLFSDADAALTRLRPTFRLGLITDGPSAMQWAKIEALRLRDRFDAIIVTDDLGPGFAKPHPRAFEQMVERLCVQHSECVYVADNPAKDFVAPRKLGWRTVQMDRPNGIYKHAVALSRGEPDQILASLDELERALA